MPKIIELINISKSYDQGSSSIPVLENLSMNVNKGEFISITGPSGSGKSTLLNIIGLIDSVDSGESFFFGKNSKDMSMKQENLIRRNKLGFIYQSKNLFSDFTAVENVSMPQILIGKNKSDSFKYSKNILDKFGLGNMLNHLPKDLSGGEQQRVAIARSVINNPELIIADEPTGNLDIKTALSVFDYLMDFIKSKNISLIMATHNLNLALRSDAEIKLN